MSPAEARARANELTKYINDPEAGHIRLDDLIADILKAVSVSTSVEECTELGAIALYAISLVPVRWCA